MKIFLSTQDSALTLISTRIDLPALIQSAGHECVNMDARELYAGRVDSILAQVQTSYEQYQLAASKISPQGMLVTHRYLDLLDKAKANDALQQLNLNYLNGKAVTCREDIETFADEMVILKPTSSMNSKSDYQFSYRVMPKSELLAYIDNSDINFTTQSYMIQEGVTNSRPIIWIGGYVNPQGEILIDGILDQHFSINDKHFEDELRYPLRHNIQIEEVKLSDANEFHNECIRQIKVVLQHFEAKSTPFCIQCIVDDDDEVQIMDFNFGFGKIYALRIREKTPQYIIDRIKYTYGGADTIPANDTYMMNCSISTPNGITDEIKEYIKDRSIFTSMVVPDKDYVLGDAENPIRLYYRYENKFICVASSKEEAQQEIENFKTFTSTLT